MKSYTVGQDSFSHEFTVEPSTGLVAGARAFQKMLGGWQRYALCLGITATLGAFLISLLAEGPFLQFFYIQLLLLVLFTLGLILVMKQRLEKNVLGEGSYKLEGDETQIRLFSTRLGTQRYGLANIDRISKMDAGTEILLHSGFIIPVEGVNLELGNGSAEIAAPPENQRSIWFAEG